VKRGTGAGGARQDGTAPRRGAKKDDDKEDGGDASPPPRFDGSGLGFTDHCSLSYFTAVFPLSLSKEVFHQTKI
jgi:hypothetical protein